jgi:hypothetical protein
VDGLIIDHFVSLPIGGCNAASPQRVPSRYRNSCLIEEQSLGYGGLHSGALKRLGDQE